MRANFIHLNLFFEGLNNNVIILISTLVVLVVLVVSVLLLIGRKRLQSANKLLAARNREIKSQKTELDILNQKMFASNLKIDKQNIELRLKNEKINIKKEKLTEKAIDLLVLNREIRMQGKLREGLTNMIVHDLKNPISNIITLSENKEITFFAKEILTMVENILDVQKYEGILMPLKKNDYSLNSIVDNAVKQIEIFAERKNIKIENQISPNFFVIVDEDIIRRVFVNLISNSIKYTPINGLIEIFTDKDNVEVGYIRVNVRDNGIGIKKDKLRYIFNKFKQVMAKQTGQARSTGLGLTFCKLAVEAHEGDIEVASIPGKYTMFSFLIQLSDYEPINAIDNSAKVKAKIILTDEEKSYLKDFYEKLDSVEVYEIGKLKKITEQIDGKFSENVYLWKQEIDKAIFSCNDELYKKTLKILDKGE